MSTLSKPSLLKRSLNARTALLYLLPSIILFSVFVFYPMFRTIYLSFYLTDQAGKAALFVGFENYAYLLESSAFRNSVKATVLFVIYTVPVGIILSLFLALLQMKNSGALDFFGQSIPQRWVSLLQRLPLFGYSCFTRVLGCSIGFSAYSSIPQVQWLLDPEWALISVSISTIWMNTGFSFLILLGGLQNIDQHLYESARIDGAGYFYRLRRITLPMFSPTLFFIITISLINAFQTFGQIDILTKGGPSQSTNLIVYSIYREAFINYQFGTASAQAVFLFICILVVTILQFKLGERKVHYQ